MGFALKNESAVSAGNIAFDELEDFFESTSLDAITYGRKLCRDLKKIAEKDDLLGDTLEENKKILPKELLRVWETYLTPAELYGISRDAINRINEKQFNEKPLTKEEIRLYGKYVEQVKAHCEEKVGCSLAATLVVTRAKRYYKLLALKAPEIVSHHEAVLLIKAIVLHMMDRSIEENND